MSAVTLASDDVYDVFRGGKIYPTIHWFLHWSQTKRASIVGRRTHLWHHPVFYNLMWCVVVPRVWFTHSGWNNYSSKCIGKTAPTRGVKILQFCIIGKFSDYGLCLVQTKYRGLRKCYSIELSWVKFAGRPNTTQTFSKYLSDYISCYIVIRNDSTNRVRRINYHLIHCNDVIMSVMVSQVTLLTIVCSSVYSGAYQRKHQSSASLAFVRGIDRWPVNSPHKGPVTRKMFPFDDVIMVINMHTYTPTVVDGLA